MGKKDQRVDAYIAKSADFAKPILNYLRDLVHEACPDVEEDMKWSRPCFMYKGMFCGMSAFKEHCAFGFWKSSLIVDKNANSLEQAAGQFGRITKLADLPPKKVMTEYIKLAKKLNDQGVPSPTRSQTQSAPRAGRSRRSDEGVETKQGRAHVLRRIEPQPQTRVH